VSQLNLSENGHVHIYSLEKINELLPELSVAVAAKDWVAVRSAAVKLKYLQGIDHAAEAWPNQVSDH
jgi:molecular chaperone HscB